MNYYLVLIETTGNQRFIFSTNKLRENAGASEMIYRVGTKYFLEAVEAGNGPQLSKLWDDTRGLTEALADPKQNPPIEDDVLPIEIVIAASGKSVALIKSDTDAIAKGLIRDVTTKAIKDSPGVSVHGVFVPLDFQQASLHEIVKQAHDLHEQVRTQLPAAQNRFPGLPVVATCATSGLPAASHDDSVPGKPAGEPRSKVSRAKRKIGGQAFKRMRKIAGDRSLAKDLEVLEQAIEALEWLAVIHADGNGLGRLFKDLSQYLPKSEQNNRGYINAYRRLSMSLDLCTQQAFQSALKQCYGAAATNETIPVVPMVVGGDDLTIVCEGKMATRFAVEFLEAFEQTTGQCEAITRIAENAFSIPRLGSCAGVVVVKPHFPFHAAYQMAEALLASAKFGKTIIKKTADNDTPYTAIDFYVHNMSSHADLGAVREGLRTANRTVLYGGPYIVSDVQRLEQATQSEHCRKWIASRTWNDLANKVHALLAPDPTDPAQRAIPSSLLHRIRDELREGHDKTDRYVQTIRHRYGSLANLMESDGSLFWQESRREFRDAAGHCTKILDAMNLAGFDSSLDGDQVKGS